jgi:hypothetical protein
MFKINILKSSYLYLKNYFLIIFFLSFITIIPIIGFIQTPMEGYWFVVEPLTTKVNFKELKAKNTSRVFNNYFNSIFGFRKFFIQIKTYMRYIFKLNSNLTIFGKDNFLYQLYSPPNTKIFYGVKRTPPTEDLIKVRKAYPQNIPIIYINYPVKQVVYPNQVPNYYNIEIIRNNKTITSINGVYHLDLTEYLQNYAKQNPNDLIYYKGDSHWTSYGGYLSYKKIIAFMNNKLHSNFKIPPLKNTNIIYTPTSLYALCLGFYVYVKSLADLCVKNDQFLYKAVNILYKEGTISESVKFNCRDDNGISNNYDCTMSYLITNSNIKTGTILIFGSSFTYAPHIGLSNFLIHNFRNIYFIHSNFTTNNKDIYKNLVKEIKPDIIFLIIHG